MKISVVVPVWNEAQTITALLDGLLAQTRPPDEIIVADNGSTDSTPAIVERYVKNRRPVKLVRGGRGLPGRGRNRGVAAARYDWIAFIDAGTLPESDWLEQLERQASSNPRAEAVYGAFRPVTDTLFTECAAMAYLSPPDEIDGVLARTRSTASLMLRKELWKKAGGFPEHLRSAEDLVFLSKIEAAGERIVQAPRAVVHCHKHSKHIHNHREYRDHKNRAHIHNHREHRDHKHREHSDHKHKEHIHNQREHRDHKHREHKEHIHN